MRCAIKYIILFLAFVFVLSSCKEDEQINYSDADADFTYEIISWNDTVVRYQFNNFSNGAESYRWTFGDNLASNKKNPTHDYIKNGIYEVVLYAYNEAGFADTSKQNIEVDFYKLPPKAHFLYELNDLGTVVRVDFINESSNAVRYRWLFHDGFETEAINPGRNYFSSGEYYVRLSAFNSLDQVDTVSRTIIIEMK